ncbi:tetratricopeptide repeat protein [Gynurincola endophyticus]|uniref:tetratricopeptide repeat protein n=1 Tax=Gynurincola endophyticus TaxID=2479004 RepID=UPI000F8E4F87|nr:tetratricopeptide repeat protein [Gynurincola endophyticus]
MATDVQNTTTSIDKSPVSPLVPGGSFFSQYGKKIAIGLGIVVGAIVVVLGYNHFVKGPQHEQAADALWKSQEYFKVDSFALALNGDGKKPGLLKVIDEYGSTPSGNLAQFYAGVSYLQLGQFENAVKHLKAFSTSEPELKLRAAGLLGDAYSELGQTNEAIASYKEAAKANTEDDINSSEYLFRAALLSGDAGNAQDAVSLLKTIKEKYPNSQRAFEVDKYLGKYGG